MKRIILFALLFFATFLNAIDVSKDEIIPIYKSIKIATNIQNIEDAINNPTKFREQKYFRIYLLFEAVNKNSWFKLNIENSSLDELTRMLYVKWQNVDIDFYLVENDKVIYKDSLTKYKNFMLSNSFNIKANSSLQLYLNVKLIKGVDDFIYLYISSPQEVPSLITEKERFHNGIFLGLLLAMMMYNFFMFSSMRIKSYLYLGLYQLMVAIYISDIRYYLMTFLYETFDISYWGLRIVLITFSIIFSILFTKEFLKTKETMPLINNLLNIFLILYILFITNINFIIYVEFLYVVFLVAGFYSLKQGNRYALYYILGFSPKIVFSIYDNFVRGLELDVNLVYQNSIQVLTVIEAFALSMALYLQLKQTVEEKKKAQKELHEKEKLMLERSKFATMGEMLASIAHQWKQPLAHVNMIFGNLLLASENNKLTHEYLEKKHTEADKQLKYMATTIKDFSTFFSTKNKICRFYLTDIYKETIELVSARIRKLNVDVKLTVKNSVEQQNYKNELIQVVIIVLNNALDAFMLNSIENREIEMIIEDNCIHIKDNAGGVNPEILDKIFDPYFSTKDKKFGTGLGLYTAKIIVDSIIKGKIYVKNIGNGAMFTIELGKI